MKETVNNFQIKEFEAGVQLVTTITEKEQLVFNSFEEAIKDRDSEAQTRRAGGIALVAVACAGIFGSVYLASESQDDFVDYGTSLGLIVSYGVAYAGYRFYRTGDFAREQWQKLKDAAGNRTTGEDQSVSPAH